jgi:hypothetical protein
MPIETAFGDAEFFGQNFDPHAINPLFGQDFDRGSDPGFAIEP